MEAQTMGADANAQPGNGQQPAQQTQQLHEQKKPDTQQAQPTVEELAKQVEELRKQNEVAANSARHWQGQFDKLRQGVQSVAQPQQPQDPLAPFVERMTKKGYDQTQARDIAELVNDFVSPLAKELNAARGTIQATTQVEAALQAAFHLEPELMGDPRIFEHARLELQQAALSGDPRYVTPEYAISVGSLAYNEKAKPWKAAAQQQQSPAQTPQQQFVPAHMRFIAAGNGFTPAASQQTPSNQMSPEAAALYEQMKAYVSPTKK